MKSLEVGKMYYCSKLGKCVTFLYYDNGYVVVERDGEKFWMRYEDLEEITGDEEMSIEDILRREG